MHTEEKFEDIIERELLQLSGYYKGNADDYEAETALFPTEIINFIQTTQPTQWERLANNSNSLEKASIKHKQHQGCSNNLWACLQKCTDVYHFYY